MKDARIKKAIPTGRQGFTLMEVVLVMAIIAIMTSVALVYIGNNKNKTELEAASNEVASAIRETQNYALTGGVSSGGDCVEYRFNTTSGTSNYSITGLDGGGVSCGFNVNYKIGGGVNFVGANVTISFMAPHGTNSSATVVLQKGSENHYICLNSVGLVTKNGTNSTCP